ncbi:MAG: glycerophosphodiester phosphodiesterase [Gemmatimonadota bacterium]|nr:glycerophosphodiester phosphodiesterase [Gemmatimonadota bacterium]
MGKELRNPEVIAHRGIRDRYPENSLPAFEAALDAGADGVELDVHATRDGVVVVHHDPLLPPAVDSPIAGRAIASISLAALDSFELAPGVGLPTLQEALQAIGARAAVYIEIKARDIEARVAAVISSVPGAAARCAVHSFDHRITKRFATLAPHVPGGILEVGYPVEPSSLLEAADARDLWQSCEFIDEALITAVHSCGGRVIAWTCDDPAQWTHFRGIGVDGICTDRSAACASWLREIDES